MPALSKFQTWEYLAIFYLLWDYLGASMLVYFATVLNYAHKNITAIGLTPLFFVPEVLFMITNMFDETLFKLSID